MARRKTTKRRNSTSIWQIILLLVLLIGAYYLEQQGWFGQGSGSPNNPPTSVITKPTTGSGQPNTGGGAVGDAISVYFTTPDLIYPDRAASRRPNTVEQAIIADIDAAQSSVEMAVFEYNLFSIADALQRAKERGLHVELALDGENLEKEEMAAFAGQMEAAGIPVHYEETDAFLHSKFIIIDEKVVWMGSWNATVNDNYRNNNNLLRITIPEIVANYQAEFNQMREDLFARRKSSITPYPSISYNGITIENYFSPKDKPRDRIVEYLNNAQSSIRFLTFSYTDDATKDAMIARYNAGVTVEGVFEKRNANGIGAEFTPLKEAGIDVYEDGNCYTMHHKVIIIDDKIVITGSYNFTGRAEDTNDENLLIINDAGIAQQFLQEFDRVYGQARNPTTCGG